MGWLQPHMPQERKHWMDLSDQHPCPSWTDIQNANANITPRSISVCSPVSYRAISVPKRQASSTETHLTRCF
jgi:hypothetical protein